MITADGIGSGIAILETQQADLPYYLESHVQKVTRSIRMKKKERKTKLKERTRLWKEDNLSGQSGMVAETDARKRRKKKENVQNDQSLQAKKCWKKGK